MRKLSKNKKIILTVVASVLIFYLAVLLILSPIYQIAGDKTMSTKEADVVLRRSAIGIKVLYGISAVALISALARFLIKRRNK